MQNKKLTIFNFGYNYFRSKTGAIKTITICPLAWFVDLKVIWFCLAILNPIIQPFKPNNFTVMSIYHLKQIMKEFYENSQYNVNVPENTLWFGNGGRYPLSKIFFSFSSTFPQIYQLSFITFLFIFPIMFQNFSI